MSAGEYDGSTTIALDKNELPFNAPYNRYPKDSEVLNLAEKWGKHEGIPSACIYFSRGTEDAVDLLLRLYARDPKDHIITFAPSREVYLRRAQVNRVATSIVPLSADNGFEIDTERVFSIVRENTRLIFICAPNSPTGNLPDRDSVELILSLFEGYVVIDESYMDFVPGETFVKLLNKYPNLILLRSFSHAWGAAGLRLSAVIARPEQITQIRQIGPSRPLSLPVMQQAEELVRHRLDIDKWIRQIVSEREKVALALSELPECRSIFPSMANFLFVEWENASDAYQSLLSQGIAVRLLEKYLCITIGLPYENSALIGVLRRRK